MISYEGFDFKNPDYPAVFMRRLEFYNNLKAHPERIPAITHTSVIKTTFLLYFATPAGMMALCDATGAVSIIGRWKLFA